MSIPSTASIRRSCRRDSPIARRVADSRRRSRTDSDSVLATPMSAITTATPSSPTTIARSVSMTRSLLARSAPGAAHLRRGVGQRRPDVLEHERRVGARVERDPEHRRPAPAGASSLEGGRRDQGVDPAQVGGAPAGAGPSDPPGAGSESSHGGGVRRHRDRPVGRLLGEQLREQQRAVGQAVRRARVAQHVRRRAVGGCDDRDPRRRPQHAPGRSASRAPCRRRSTAATASVTSAGRARAVALHRAVDHEVHRVVLVELLRQGHPGARGAGAHHRDERRRR